MTKSLGNHEEDRSLRASLGWIRDGGLDFGERKQVVRSDLGMAAARVLSGSAAMASMTARLNSKLSLRQENKLVDLRNLKSSGIGFVALRFYLVGKLNFARAVQFRSFRSAVQAMWRLSMPVEGQHHGDCFLFMFNNQRDLGRVKKGDATLRLVGETIRPVLNIDQAGLRRGSTRVNGVIRNREEDETEGGKRLKHSLAMVPLDLNLENLGFSMVVCGELGIKKTGKSPKKRGRPRGSKNKKQLYSGELSSSMVDTVIQEPPATEESGGE
ncbi:hypothetical protein ACLB2K_004642 [Fragaria x ananassa]